MLGNQLLEFGSPEEVLQVATPIPGGKGHAESLLHALAAQALSKLDRLEEARKAAESAIATAPTTELKTDLALDLKDILEPPSFTPDG